jgi:hypothetical protein
MGVCNKGRSKADPAFWADVDRLIGEVKNNNFLSVGRTRRAKGIGLLTCASLGVDGKKRIRKSANRYNVVPGICLIHEVFLGCCSTTYASANFG